MCSAPKAPKIPKPEPLPEPEPLPTPEPLPIQQQVPPPPPVAPMPQQQAQPAAPTPPPVPLSAPIAPPPQSVDGSSDELPVVKKRKSKRDVLQQQNKGASALRIKRGDKSKSIGSVATGNTGSTGLNIPKS